MTMKQEMTHCFACKPFVWLTSAGILLLLSFESLLCFLASTFSTTTLLTTFSHFTAKLEPLLVLVFCLTGKSCSSLFTPLLKLELATLFMRFCSSLIRSIHSDICFVLKKLQVQTKLYSRKVPKGFDIRMNEQPMRVCSGSGPSTTLKRWKSRWRCA